MLLVFKRAYVKESTKWLANNRVESNMARLLLATRQSTAEQARGFFSFFFLAFVFAALLCY